MSSGRSGCLPAWVGRDGVEVSGLQGEGAIVRQSLLLLWSCASIVNAPVNAPELV
ncbi:MAG: hypothetical protein VKJ24_12880 [Synechococcales bacterium]|nr:hypothetical protein [Synechococcales bacterium]